MRESREKVACSESRLSEITGGILDSSPAGPQASSMNDFRIIIFDEHFYAVLPEAVLILEMQ